MHSHELISSHELRASQSWYHAHTTHGVREPGNPASPLQFSNLEYRVALNMATTASSNASVVNSPAVEAAFERAVNRFKISLDDEVRAEFDKITTEADVRNLLEQMEVDQGNRKSLRNARRLEPFLNFMSQYSKVIEVFLGVWDLPSYALTQAYCWWCRQSKICWP